MIDTLTRGESSEDTETMDISDSRSRLGLPTDRDIDLRKRFVEDETERSDCLEVDQCAQTTQHSHQHKLYFSRAAPK